MESALMTCGWRKSCNLVSRRSDVIFALLAFIADLASECFAAFNISDAISALFMKVADLTSESFSITRLATQKHEPNHEFVLFYV
jgi:hypothetical protein